MEPRLVKIKDAVSEESPSFCNAILITSDSDMMVRLDPVYLNSITQKAEPVGPPVLVSLAHAKSIVQVLQQHISSRQPLVAAGNGLIQ